MATTARPTGLPNLLDLTKLMGPDGTQLALVETLSRMNPFMEKMTWKESNGPTGHVIAARTALPSVSVRRLNEGVPKSKGKTDRITEGCAMFAGLSKVDPALARISGNVGKFRASEDAGFVTSMNNRFEDAVFYDSSKTAPENLMGLSPRLDLTTGNYGGQIISSQIAHSGNDQTSIWFMVSGPDTVYGIVPKGVPGGIIHKDLDEVLSTDDNGNEWPMLTTTFELNAGLCVQDARYLVRLANIDTGAIVKTGKLLIEDMTAAVFRLLDLKKGTPMIFANRTMCQYLFLQAQDSVKSATLSIEQDIETRQAITKFMGIPIYMTDALLNTEAVVS